MTCSSVMCTSCTRGVDVRRHVDVHVGRPPGRARHRARSARSSSAAGRRAASSARTTLAELAACRDSERDVARPAQRLDLAREHPVEAVVVRDAGQHAARRSSARWPHSPRRSRSEPPDQFRRHVLRRRPRIRRCRTPAPSLPAAATPTMAAAAADGRLEPARAHALVQRDRLAQRRVRDVTSAQGDPSAGSPGTPLP